MKFSTILPYAGMVFLIYLAFVNNIPGHSGLEDNKFEDIIRDSGAVEQYAGFIGLNEFLEFMKKENNTIVNYSHEEYLDTTGDGENELVRSSFKIANNVCQIEHVIIKDDEKIWDERFQISESELDIYFGNIELIESQKEKALGFLGLVHSPFVEKIDVSKESVHRKRKLLEYHFRNSNLTFQQKINSEFYNDLTNYCGHFIFKRNAANAGIYMWDKATKSFIEVFSVSEIV